MVETIRKQCFVNDFDNKKFPDEYKNSIILQKFRFIFKFFLNIEKTTEVRKSQILWFLELNLGFFYFVSNKWIPKT